MKIRNKLTYLFAIIVGSILLVFSIYIYFFSYQYRQTEFYERLRDKAFTTAKLLIGPRQIDRNLLKTLDKRDATVLHAEEIMIFDDQDQEIYDSGSDTIPITHRFLNNVRKHKEVKLKYDKTEILGVIYQHNNKEYVVVTSAFDSYGYMKLKNLEIILVLGCLSSMAVVLTAGWFFSYKALEPMNDIVNQVDEISGTDLSKRVKSRFNKDEIAHLAQTFNKMLSRVEKAFEAQRSFVSNASHELRTPLTVIRGQIEVILLKEREPEEYQSVLKSILDDIKDLTDLSNALLELARVSGDSSAIHLESLRIDELIFQARADLMKKRHDCKIEIFFEALPDEEEKLEVPGIEKLLKIAFINLMENGCKFSLDKKIKVILTASDNNMVVRFCDNGLGIEPKDLINIFEPFYRGANVTTVTGYGVGLSLTKKIVEIHRGEIEVESVVNQGTTFTLTFHGNRPH